ncbi:MAG: extensin family protein [Sphingosinicella sp.]|nr:extensin family protein [Sphingosinicella sp.]
MRWGALLSLTLLAACIPKAEQRPAVPPSRPSPNIVPADPDVATRQCHADLRREGVQFRILPDRVFDGGCTALGSVQLLDIGTPVANLGAMTCPLAHQLARWTREAVQPAAEQWLGAQVVRIESMGTYSCRPINGQAGGKLSEHGRANAVDIGAFILSDGRRISLLTGWNGQDENVKSFLRSVHREGCRRFQIGLGPDANSFHRDHLHFDMGRGPYCR